MTKGPVTMTTLRRSKYSFVGVVLLLSLCLGIVVYQMPRTRENYESPPIVIERDQSTSKPKSWTKQGTCVNGYLDNFPSICGADGCLPILPGRDQDTEVPPMPQETRMRILQTPGWMGEKNIDAVWYFTRAQREFGIYGSVGEIGVYHGRYSSAMAQWLDTEAGERMFACDLFSGKEFAHLKTVPGSQKESYEKTLKIMDLSFSHTNDARRIRLFQDTSVHLSKAAILDMDLPAFRLFSVDGGHFHPVPVLDMLFTSCVVRDGAVISVDDALAGTHPQVYDGVRQFFTYFGQNVWRPFLSVTNKLYLVQTSWYDRYLEWFHKHNVFQVLNAKLENNPKRLFGTKYEYFKIPLKPGESRSVVKNSARK